MEYARGGRSVELSARAKQTTMRLVLLLLALLAAHGVRAAPATGESAAAIASATYSEEVKEEEEAARRQPTAAGENSEPRRRGRTLDAYLLAAVAHLPTRSLPSREPTRGSDRATQVRAGHEVVVGGGSDSASVRRLPEGLAGRLRRASAPADGARRSGRSPGSPHRARRVCPRSDASIGLMGWCQRAVCKLYNSCN